MRFFERSKYIHISLIDLLHRRIAFFAAGERFFVEFLGFQVGLTDQHQRIVEIIREFVRSQFERLAESLQRFRRIAQFVVNSTQACPQLGIVRIVGNTLLDIRNNGIGIFARLRIQHDQLFEDLVVFRIFAKAGNQCLFRFFEILLRPVAVIQIIVSLPVAFVTVGDRIVQVFDPLVEFAGERIQVAGIETADRIDFVQRSLILHIVSRGERIGRRVEFTHDIQVVGILLISVRNLFESLGNLCLRILRFQLVSLLIGAFAGFTRCKSKHQAHSHS